MIRAERLVQAADDPDWQLVAAARARVEAAIRELVRRLNPRLFRIARGILPTDAEAEEAVQEAYLAAFSKLDSFRGEARFSTWITRITINVARMQARRPRPEKDHATVTDDLASSADVLAFPGAETAEAGTGRREVRALLEEALARLPLDLLLPFLLHEAEGQPILAIARDLGLNPITVRTRRRLRAALEARLRGGFETVFPFDGVRCARMADRVVGGLKGRTGGEHVTQARKEKLPKQKTRKVQPMSAAAPFVRTDIAKAGMAQARHLGLQKGEEVTGLGALAAATRPYEVIAVAGRHCGGEWQCQLAVADRGFAQRQIPDRDAMPGDGGGIALLQRIEQLTAHDIDLPVQPGFAQPAPPVAPVGRGVDQVAHGKIGCSFQCQRRRADRDQPFVE